MFDVEKRQTTLGSLFVKCEENRKINNRKKELLQYDRKKPKHHGMLPSNMVFICHELGISKKM